MRRFAMFALAVGFTSASVMAAGFQVAAQGARAMGIRLAYTAVADDATSIYFSPAGLAFQGDGEALLGIMGAGNTEGRLIPREDARSSNGIDGDLPTARG